MKKVLVSAIAALAMVVGGFAAPAHAAVATIDSASSTEDSSNVSISTNCSMGFGYGPTLIPSNDINISVNNGTIYHPSAGATLSEGGQISLQLAAPAAANDVTTVTYVGTGISCIARAGTSLTTNQFAILTVRTLIAAPTNLVVTSPQAGWIQLSWTAVAGAGSYLMYLGATSTGTWNYVSSTSATTFTITGQTPTTAVWVKVVTRNSSSQDGRGVVSTSAVTPSGGVQVTPPSVVTTIVPQVPVFKQPKFAMPSKIDVDATGKVSLSGKDMGVSTVLIGGKEQKIDTNSDEKLVFDTTGLAKGVHDLVMKGAFGTYTVQKAIQVGEAVVTKVATVSARQVGMAGGELSISGQGLEGTTQITMNGQVLEIVSRTDSKVTFKVPASTVASVNSIMIEGSFVPVLFKNAFSYTK